MRFKDIFILLLMAYSSQSFSGNYLLAVDGKEYELNLDSESQLVIDGKSLSVILKQKQVLRFNSQSFYFDHPKDFMPLKTELNTNIYQTAVMTPLGTVVMVQEYLDMNPEPLIDLMINEVTKKEREYGYKIIEEQKVIELNSSQKLKGKLIQSTFKGSNIERFVGAYGTRDAGVLVLTQIDYEIDEKPSDFIEQIMSSLTLKM